MEEKKTSFLFYLWAAYAIIENFFFFLLNAFKLIHGKKKGKLLAQSAIGIFQANKIKQKS